MWNGPTLCAITVALLLETQILRSAPFLPRDKFSSFSLSFLYQISKERGCELMLGFSRPILNINVIYSFGSSFPGSSFKMDKDCEAEYRP